MRAFIAQGLSTILAVGIAGSSLLAAEREQSQSQFGDFGESNLQREAAELKLKFEDGKTYRWDIEAKPQQEGYRSQQKSGSERSQSSGGSEKGQSSTQGQSSEKGQSSSQSGSSMMCKHQAEAKVTKSSGEETTIAFTFDASQCQFCKEQAQKQGQKPPEKLTYQARVSQQGQVLSFEEQGGGGGGGQSQAAEYKNMIMTQARQLVGEGLHQGRLEPGKTYDVSWMRPESWKKGSGGSESGRAAGSSSSGRESEQSGKRPTAGEESQSGTSRATAQSGGSGSQRFQLRYEGRTRAEGDQVALFNISSSGGSSSGSGSRSGGSESRSSSQSSGGAGGPSSRSIDGNGGGSGGEAGKAAFRLEDGLLEKFAFILPASVMKEMHKDEEKSGGAGSMPQGDMLITIRRSE